MFSALRKQITPATVLAFVALVFAVTGGAFAATGGSGNRSSHATLTASVAKAKAKPKAGARGPAGPKGATGAAGATGSAGATGPAGPSGPAGSTGPAGGVGPQGIQGVHGEKGEKGEKGKPGEKGEPGETGFTSTLPPEKTETGTYVATSNGSKEVSFAISFAIPLTSQWEHDNLVTPKDITEDKIPAGCGGSSAKPEAAPGNLCVFEGIAGEITVVNILAPAEGAGAGTTGAAMLGATQSPNELVVGTWAVTAPKGS